MREKRSRGTRDATGTEKRPSDPGILTTTKSWSVPCTLRVPGRRGKDGGREQRENTLHGVGSRGWYQSEGVIVDAGGKLAEGIGDGFEIGE